MNCNMLSAQRGRILLASNRAAVILLFAVMAFASNVFSQDTQSEDTKSKADETAEPSTAAELAPPETVVASEPTATTQAAASTVKSDQLLERLGRTKPPADDHIEKPIESIAEIAPKPDTDRTVILALIEDLLKLGIERCRLREVGNLDNSVVVTLPSDVTWRRVRQIEDAIAKHPTFRARLLVAGNNDPVTSSLQPSNQDGTIESGADPKSEPASKADSTDVTDPFARCKFSLQQHIRAADVARIIEQLHGHADADANALTVDVEESTNSIIVHGRVAVLNEIQALLNHLHTGSKKANDNPLSANNSVFESGKDLDIDVRNPAPGPLSRLPNFPMPAEKVNDREFSFYIGDPRDGETADQLRSASNDRERESRALAKQLHEPLPDPATGDKLKAALRDIVRQAFETRQKLQRAELAEFAQRLQGIQQSIETRDSIAEQIIDRRVNELLDPNLKWEDSTSDVGGRAPALGTSATTPSRLTSLDGSRRAVTSGKVELADLQGNWRLICTTFYMGKNNAGRIEKVIKKATIAGNRVSVTSPGEIVPKKFVLHLDGNASPQPIDLEYDFSADEQIEDSIDAYPLRDGKPIALGIIERRGGSFRICIDCMKTAGRPPAFVLNDTRETWDLDTQ